MPSFDLWMYLDASRHILDASGHLILIPRSLLIIPDDSSNMEDTCPNLTLQDTQALIQMKK